MKTLVFAMIILGMALPAVALDKAQVEDRARKLIQRFETMQQKADKRVPPDLLKKCKGVVLLDRTKGGFIFAYEGGAGLALVKDKKGKWGPLAFLSANEASLGFQIGGQRSFFVILIMTDEGTRLLTDSNYEVGGEARGTAGDSSTGQGQEWASPDRPILVFDDRKGLFGGAAIKAGAIAPDNEANRVYYDDALTVKEILFDGKVKPTETAIKLGKKFDDYAAGK